MAVVRVRRRVAAATAATRHYSGDKLKYFTTKLPRPQKVNARAVRPGSARRLRSCNKHAVLFGHSRSFCRKGLEKDRRGAGIGECAQTLPQICPQAQLPLLPQELPLHVPLSHMASDQHGVPGSMQ